MPAINVVAGLVDTISRIFELSSQIDRKERFSSFTKTTKFYIVLFLAASLISQPYHYQNFQLLRFLHI